MITTDLLKRIQKKHPEYSKEQIKLILTQHLGLLNSKLSRSQTLDLTIPKLGRVHTHGNAINDKRLNINKTVKLWTRKKTAYSDSQLLF